VRNHEIVRNAVEFIRGYSRGDCGPNGLNSASSDRARLANKFN
jgi:hypothetical protein